MSERRLTVDDRLPDWWRSHFSRDKARREAVTWKRTSRTCPDCSSAETRVGWLDGDEIVLGCFRCGASVSVAFV